MSLLLHSSRLVLAAVFTIAGISKALNLASARKTVADFGLPPWLADPAGTLLPFAEMAIAATLIPGQTAWGAAVAALALLLVFIAGIAANLVQGRKPACNCFGHLTPSPIGRSTVVRNVALASCAGLSVLAGRGPSSTNAVAGLAGALGIRPIIFVAVAGVAAALAAETFVLWHLLRQHGRLALRIDDLEHRLSGSSVRQFPAGLAIGDAAPVFELPALAGGVRSLSTLRQRGAATLLLFTDPHCQPCAALLPRVTQWQQLYADRIAIALVSRGDQTVNRELAARHGVANVLIQRDNEVADAYRIAGTPAGVVIRADGRIGSAPAFGDQAIASLLDTLNSEPRAAAGERGGAVADSDIGLTYGTAFR